MTADGRAEPIRMESLRAARPDMVTEVAAVLEGIGHRMARLLDVMETEVTPRIHSADPEERAIAAGHAACIGQEIAAEIGRLDAADASFSRALPGFRSPAAMSTLVGVWKERLRAIAEAAQLAGAGVLLDRPDGTRGSAP